ncbi:phage head morphogenesis protein [Vitreoscilla massiliensis]|uniref:Phage head morphogenesis protein n=1 Tax=Vitreoscilla massiliensis TaxID=1689272 RepID=A0ABY4E192_9NEIS|nr:minor capsid protein [Vitreoscilla massiliensis]UOO89120.1 phage head morphogenesis protein [Vitreoscilla massiliensis]
MSIQAQINEQTIRNAVLLEGVKEDQVGAILMMLAVLDKRIKAMLSGDELVELPRSELKRLLSEVRGEVKAVLGGMIESLETNLLAIADQQADFEVHNLAIVGVVPIKPSEAKIHNAMENNPLAARGISGDGLLTSYFAEVNQREQDRVVSVIRQGVSQGLTNQQMIQQIIGTRAHKYKDGILQITRKQAEDIVRTSVQHVHAQARQAVWVANDDIVDEVEMVATLDGKTSATCRSMDGMRFKIYEGPRPPFHLRCRTTTVPVINEKYAGKGKDVSTRASMNGQVPSGMKYYDWLLTQSVEFQDEVLGPTRGKLLRDGGITAQQFASMQLDRSFQPITLERMRELYPEVFRKAAA